MKARIDGLSQGRYYVLDGRTPRAVDDVMEWAKQFSFGQHRHVAVTWGGEIRVSTVFLGLDHQYGDGPPLLFETMIFGGKHDGYQDRYSTWEQAEAGHRRACYMAQIPCGRVRNWLCMWAERAIHAYWRLRDRVNT